MDPEERPTWRDGEVTEDLTRPAADRDQAARLAQRAGHLVHDPAWGADHEVLDALTQARQLEIVKLQAERTPDGGHCRYLHRGRGGNARAQGDITSKMEIESP